MCHPSQTPSRTMFSAQIPRQVVCKGLVHFRNSSTWRSFPFTGAMLIFAVSTQERDSRGEGKGKKKKGEEKKGGRADPGGGGRKRLMHSCGGSWIEDGDAAWQAKRSEAPPDPPPPTWVGPKKGRDGQGGKDKTDTVLARGTGKWSALTLY